MAKKKILNKNKSKKVSVKASVKKSSKQSAKKSPKKLSKSKKSKPKILINKTNSSSVKKLKKVVSKKATPIKKIISKNNKLKVTSKPADSKAKKSVKVAVVSKNKVQSSKEIVKKSVDKSKVVKPTTVTTKPAVVSKKLNTEKKVENKSNSPIQKNEKKAVQHEDQTLLNLPPGKFELEYVVHSSAELLFSFLTEPSGLSEWFCDDVNIRHGIYTFFWDGTQQQAKELKHIPEKLVRFQWVEKTDGSFFEFRIEKDDLTGDISLMITDFAENEDERNSSKLLWDSQIDKLLHVLGAYF